MSAEIQNQVTVPVICTVTEIPFAVTGRFPFEVGFTLESLNHRMRSEIQRVERYLESATSFKERAREYLEALHNRIEKNEFLLNKKIQKNPDFTAVQCVRMRDIEGLKLIVANGWSDVNEQDDRGRAALHFAASQDDPELLRILMLHPKINPNLQTVRGNTPAMIASSEEIRSLLL